MSRERITQNDVWNQISRLNSLRGELGLEPIAYYAGDKVNGVTNRVVANRRSLWYDGVAGHTKREAFNALRIMVSTTAETIEHQQDMRAARARTGL